MYVDMLLATPTGPRSVTGKSFEAFIQGEKFIFFVHVNDNGEGVLSHWASGQSILKAQGATFEQCRVMQWETSSPSDDISVGRAMIKRIVELYGEARIRSNLAGARVINHEDSRKAD
jgi:hypothetical protein